MERVDNDTKSARETELLGSASDFKTPKVESTGSGGGLKLFCDGVGVNYPDIANSSRAIKQSEIDFAVAHTRPLDKAGAYAIQDDRIEIKDISASTPATTTGGKQPAQHNTAETGTDVRSGIGNRSTAEDSQSYVH